MDALPPPAFSSPPFDHEHPIPPPCGSKNQPDWPGLAGVQFVARYASARDRSPSRESTRPESAGALQSQGSLRRCRGVRRGRGGRAFRVLSTQQGSRQGAAGASGHCDGRRPHEARRSGADETRSFAGCVAGNSYRRPRARRSPNRDRRTTGRNPATCAQALLPRRQAQEGRKARRAARGPEIPRSTGRRTTAPKRYQGRSQGGACRDPGRRFRHELASSHHQPSNQEDRRNGSIRPMKRNVSILAAGLSFLLASSALAAGPADASNATERARANFHHGVKLYNEGSFEAALAEFRRAYQISPNYRLLYNIAQAYFDLHDYVNSLKALKQYVQEGGSEIAADRRIEVSELNQKLEERIANLDIVCSE